VPSASALSPMPYQNGDSIKADFDAVYYFTHGYRFTFPQDKFYFTWHEDFSDVVHISNEELAQIPLVGNIIVRPGTKLVKIQSIPTVYAVSRNGELYPIENEEVAIKLFTENWSGRVIDIQDSFWFDYTDMSFFENIDPLDGTWYPDGFLLQAEGSEDVYLIWGGMKRLFVSEESFEANGLNREDICMTTLEILDSYVEGDNIEGYEFELADDTQGLIPVPAPTE